MKIIPRTNYLLTYLTAPLTNVQTPWIFIPLLIIFYAGELVWKEREAGMSEISGAAPVPEWVLFLGKFVGLSFIIIVWLAFLLMAGVFAQISLGYKDFEIGQYLQTLLDIQLTDYLLFALLALEKSMDLHHVPYALLFTILRHVITLLEMIKQVFKPWCARMKTR